jgi:hypothetical protein
MSFIPDAIYLALLALVAVNVVGVLAYVVSRKQKVRREERHIKAITGAIVDYFRKTGVNVSADCVNPGKGRYIAIVESEPMKRFRLSHIIEMTLREHISKTCGLELDKIFWRFPIKEADQAQVQAQAQAPAVFPTAIGAAAMHDAEAPSVVAESDEYINEGLEHYKYIPKVEATELSWEHFQQAATDEQGGKTVQKDPRRAE